MPHWKSQLLLLSACILFFFCNVISAKQYFITTQRFEYPNKCNGNFHTIYSVLQEEYNDVCWRVGERWYEYTKCSPPRLDHYYQCSDSKCNDCVSKETFLNEERCVQGRKAFCSEEESPDIVTLQENQMRVQFWADSECRRLRSGFYVVNINECSYLSGKSGEGIYIKVSGCTKNEESQKTSVEYQLFGDRECAAEIVTNVTTLESPCNIHNAFSVSDYTRVSFECASSSTIAFSWVILVLSALTVGLILL